VKFRLFWTILLGIELTVGSNQPTKSPTKKQKLGTRRIETSSRPQRKPKISQKKNHAANPQIKSMKQRQQITVNK
jgi:hypothetical protein